MRPARAYASARAGLAGHPSDGYGGATLAVSVADFAASASVYPAARLEISGAGDSGCSFAALAEFLGELERCGYDGPQLARAAVRRFARVCAERGVELPATFGLRCETTIPAQVGLAGSSAVAVAAVRALGDAFGVALAPVEVAALALACETEELGIPAGPQDRVAQACGGLVYMDFGCAPWRVEALDPALLPPLYLAYLEAAGEPSARAHGDLRERFERRDAVVVAGMSELRALAGAARDALRAGDVEQFARVVDDGYEVRRRMCSLDPRHERMVLVARGCAPCATFAGSGGAVVGVAPPEGAQRDRLAGALREIGCVVVWPRVG